MNLLLVIEKFGLCRVDSVFFIGDDTIIITDNCYDFRLVNFHLNLVRFLSDCKVDGYSVIYPFEVITYGDFWEESK